MRKFLVLFFLVFLTSCGSKYERSLVEYNKVDFEKAVRICDGDDGYGCRFIRGMGYIYGRGLEQDVRKGITLVKEASDHGIVQAQSELGVFYLKGFGVPQNYALGTKLIKMAADKGNALACYNLGLIYKNGRVVEKDLEKAIRYSIEAFEKGKADGALIAGKAFYEKKDYYNAVQWFKKGSEKGSLECEYTLGLYYEEMLHRDFHKAYSWYKSAAEKGYLDAIHKVGVYNYNGYGRPANVSEAIRWFSKSAERENVLSQYFLGYIYYSKSFQKFDKSLYWYKKAAKNGNVQAITQIGFHYLNGEGVKKDEKKAIEIFKEALEKGDTGAAFILGRIHELGIGTEKNMKKAFEKFEYAADKGHDGAIKKLVKLHIIDKDCEKALERFTKSFRFGASYIRDAGYFLYFEKECIDKNRSVKYVIDASEKGDSKAQEFLAALYFDGSLVKKDYIEAYAWINISLSKTRTKSAVSLRNKIERSIGVDDVRRAQERSLELIRKYGFSN